MAKRRMFSIEITGSDAFRTMPLSAQALYFQISMEADDDGFVSNVQTTIRSVGAKQDALRQIIRRRFVLEFQNEILVIKHWRKNNFLRNDRYTPSGFVEEKKHLFIKKDGSYTLDPKQGEPFVGINQQSGIPVVNQTTTNGIPVVNLGKGSVVEVSKDESIKGSETLPGGATEKSKNDDPEFDVIMKKYKDKSQPVKVAQ